MFNILVTCLLAFGAAIGLAEHSPEATWKLLEKQLTGKGCAERAKEFSEFRLLLALPEFKEFLESPSTLRGKLSPVLQAWSTDLLVKVVFQLEQELRPACKPFPRNLEKLSSELKTIYLSKIGIPAGNDSDKRFRAFVSLKEDAIRIQKLLSQMKIKTKLDTLSLVKLVYGNAVLLKGVWILSPHPINVKKWEAFLVEVCPNDCPFWDPLVLYRVSLAAEPGVAAFVPEVSNLVLSEDLIETSNLLHKVVVLHEFAHVAERRAWLRDRLPWLEEFRKYSGWKKSESGEWSADVLKSEEPRNDELTKLSASSPYSILPDPVYLAQTVLGKNVDGFVMAKGYEQSIRENDPAEDFADHVAIYRFFPERFCFNGKPIAPQKFAWVNKHLFSLTPKIPCQ